MPGSCDKTWPANLGPVAFPRHGPSYLRWRDTAAAVLYLPIPCAVFSINAL